MAFKSSWFATQSIVFQADRAIFIVQVKPSRPCYTDQEIAQWVRQAYPELEYHQCLNEWEEPLWNALSHTSMPHVLEHILITEQVRSTDEDDSTQFLGTTRWLNEAEGIARIDVHYTSDIMVLEAYKQALNFLETYKSHGMMRT